MSLPKIVLETEKTVPVYGLPLRIRQGDKGDVLTVLLGKSFVTYPDLSDIDVTLIAERSDQTLVKAAASEKSGNTFSVTLPDAMYAKVGVFRRVYFKIGDDSTSDIKIEVLSGTGSSSANGNYIQDFEDLLNQAMSYVYVLNSLAGTYDAVIDTKVTELTGKMQSFVDQAQEDLDAAKKAWNTFQNNSETAASDQRDGFDTDYGKQKADFETRFKSYLDKLQDDYDSFKLTLTTDVSDLNEQLNQVGTDVSALDAKADEISGKLQDVDLSQMATNEANISKLQADVKTNTADLNSKIATGVGQAKTYAEQSIKDIIGAAPETLDTIAELADAVTENKDGVQAINDGITKKADKTDVTALQNTVQTMITSISQEDYDALVSAGTVDPKIVYVIPDA